jgi:hypothetical protein
LKAVEAKLELASLEGRYVSGAQSGSRAGAIVFGSLQVYLGLAGKAEIHLFGWTLTQPEVKAIDVVCVVLLCVLFYREILGLIRRPS